MLNTITRRFLPACFIRLMSLIPRPRPRPKIGPIKGEINIAPIITGMEFTFRPTEAISMATARIQAFGPLNSMLFLIERSAVSVSICPSRFVIYLMKRDNRLNIVKYILAP